MCTVETGGGGEARRKIQAGSPKQGVRTNLGKKPHTIYRCVTHQGRTQSWAVSREARGTTSALSHTDTCIRTCTHMLTDIHSHPCTLMHTGTLTHNHTCTCVHVHSHSHVYSGTHIHSNTHSCTYMGTHSHIYSCVCIHSHRCAYIYTLVHTCALTCACLRMCIFTNVHAHTHTHTQVLKSGNWLWFRKS